MSSATDVIVREMVPRPLGDGLVMRPARMGDGAELAEFNATMHADDSLPRRRWPTGRATCSTCRTRRFVPSVT